jgi:hypothetical protein
MDEKKIPKKVLYMNLETTRWQDEVRENGRLVGEKDGRKGYITERNGRSF